MMERKLKNKYSNMKNLKFGFIILTLGVLTLGINVYVKAQEVVECNWSMEECHRVEVGEIIYVYHGEKVEEEQQ